MAEEYDVQAIMNVLKEKEEMDPAQHDGSYELMHETIKAYGKLRDFSTLDYKDLNLVYLTSVGTWKQGIESKKNMVNNSHLLSNDKQYLTKLWDKIWEKAGRGEYSNYELDANGNRSIGMFGTGFFSFQNKTTDGHVRDFIRMCVDILPMTDDMQMFDRAAQVLNASFMGMRAASASMVLHCLKPNTFPVLNSNMGNRNIFEVLGVDLVKRGNIETYIDNCRRIKSFRDKNFSYKNYRIFDMTAWKVKEFVISHEKGKFDSWEIVSEDVARIACEESFFLNHGSDVPGNVRWFFRAEGIQSGRNLGIVLIYEGVEYDGYIRRESVSPARTNLYWDSSLAEEFASFANDGLKHLLEFRRRGENRYEVGFVDGSNISRVWLISWNKDKWDWPIFEQKCKATQIGRECVESWACANSNPRIGEEVFLIKLGDQPRGIIGHGTVVRPIYEKAHYDVAKAAEGKKEKAIDVRFDYLIDYNKDKYISQEELNTKCAGQHWSPQSSGIEIKPSVLPTLRKMWLAVTSNHKQYGFSEMVSFLADYTGKPYTVPAKVGDQAEYMAEMEKRGNETRDKYVAFIRDIKDQLPGLEYVSCSDWLDQGQVVERNLWAELKKKEWMQYPQSVLISLSTHDSSVPGVGQYISIRTKTSDVISTPLDYQKQLRLLDCDLFEGMAYLVKHVNGMYEYLGTDKERVRQLCENGRVLKLQVIKNVENLPEKDIKGTIFGEVLKAAKEISTLYEHVMQQDDESVEDEWWPSLAEYNPGITAEQYYELFLDKDVSKKEWIEALYDLYQIPEHLGTCADLESRFNKPYARYNRFLTSLARRIRERTGCPVPEDQDSSAYWPVLFQGKSVESDDSHKGIYCWKMRKPVVKAMEMLIEEGVFTEVPMNTAVPQFDHNLILYGPPGTGKTYYSVIYAVAICDGKSIEEVSRKPYSETLARYKELKEEGRIAFTTFHQSYGYEEFIEGIKPRLDSESESLGYTIEDGIFKEFCKRANSTKAHANDSLNIKQNPHIWGMLLGGTGASEIKRDCFENSVIRFGWDRISDADVMEDDVDDTKLDRFAKHQTSNFIYSMEAGDVVVIAKSITTIDAIGVITGEYEYDETKESYCRTRKVKWLAKDIEYDILPFLPNGRKKLPTSYLYPLDYIGIDAVSSILDELNGDSGIYLEHETEPYVFIIDEINRGNISKIFGELITLIEETKRAGAAEAMEAILPYSGEPFTVPNNVFIIGTMNTADRSIALMDTALRRRFEFREMMPDSKVLDKLGVGTITIDGVELNVSKMLDVINERIEYLFDREHTIGHAFFSKLANDCSIETLACIFEKNVVPLLQEYFYEDYEKIQLVLGDNSKEDEFKFILDYPIKVKDIFNGSPDIDLPEKGYSIQHDAFLKLDSYKKIGRDL